MYRRTYLAAIASALSVGCVSNNSETSEKTPADGGNKTETPTPKDIDDMTVTYVESTRTTESTPIDSPVTVELVIESQSGRARAGTCTIVHMEAPKCRYAGEHSCDSPTEETTVLNEPFDLSPDEQRVFTPVEVEIEANGEVVDIYEVSVQTGDGAAELDGLEAGAASVMGRETARKYPWRVAARRYRVHAVLEDDSVELFVRAGA